MDDDWREKWAQFRFEVIGELLNKNLDRAERIRIRKEILSRTFIRPDGKAWKVAERTLSEWIQRYEKGGLRELANRVDKRKGAMKALDPQILEQAKTLRLALPSRSIQDIRSHLKYVSNVDIAKIAPATLNRHLNRIGAVKDKDYSEKGAFQHFQKAHINQMWQSDCTDGLYLPDPKGLKEVRHTTLITCIDDASRFCVHGQFYFGERLTDLLDCFRTALISRGKGSVLYTDNGSIYKAGNFAKICSELGVTLKHCEVQHPEGKGKQERHYLTIQMRFYKEAKKSGIQTLQELNEFFWAWLDECYHKVNHSELGMTPLERWQMEEQLIERIPIEKIHDAMQLRAKRQINEKTALIKLDGRLYQASRTYAGQHVQIRWPFDDESHVKIYRKSVPVERAERFVPGTDIDFSKRPQRPVKKPEPKVLECSKKYRAALVAKFRNEKAPIDTSRFGVLSERELTMVVGQCLERSLDEREVGILEDSYLRLFPIDADFVEKALSKAKASKGPQMHIGFYVKYMEEFKFKMR